ncbi:hypothetical protein ACFLY0_02130 [Patescibacteria group bacterium]
MKNIQSNTFSNTPINTFIGISILLCKMPRKSFDKEVLLGFFSESSMRKVVSALLFRHFSEELDFKLLCTLITFSDYLFYVETCDLLYKKPATFFEYEELIEFWLCDNPKIKHISEVLIKKHFNKRFQKEAPSEETQCQAIRKRKHQKVMSDEVFTPKESVDLGVLLKKFAG